MMISSPSHVAVLVPSVRKAADYLSTLNFEIGEEELFEETKEIYVQGSERNSLLLMEAKETGSYRKALNKRGPGIHHLAIDVLDIDAYLESIAGSGWLLHLNSLHSMKHRTAYLARPGFPGLIEVQEKKQLMDGPLFVSEIFLNIDKSHAGMIKAVGLEDILKTSNTNHSLTMQGQKIDLQRLF